MAHFTMVSEHSALQEDFARGLWKGQFQLLYQPVVTLSSGEVAGVEALVRWHHPRLGVLSPATFISLTERTGFILPLGEWVIEQACFQLRCWRDQNLPPGLTMSVNVSPRQLDDPAFPDQVRDALARSGIAPGALDIEIAETRRLTDVHIARARELHELNVHLTLNDFGIGYSSLSTITALPLQTVKIAPCFVHPVNSHPDNSNSSLIQAIASMLRSFRLRSVAVGVENENQATALRDLGCDAAQGFHFWRPVPGDEMVGLISTGSLPKGGEAEPPPSDT